MIDRARLDRAYETARAALLAERRPGGYWEGELSTSALSTAVAVSALAKVGGHDALIAGGLRWLAAHQNADGGWGDTTRSFSNISTTLLCRAAFHLTGRANEYEATLARCGGWVAERYGRTPAEVAEAVRRRYGKDRTFSVPILMTCALAGLVEWREVPSLPFELACFPQSWYRFLGLPVVSYALPALIAIGQAVYHHRRPFNPLRKRAIGPSLRVLAKIQPSNGGFLEATPLTSFVALGLASTGKADHPVVRKCVEFIVASVRPDGSWPIDTNLSTWVTTLSVNALAVAGDLDALGNMEPLRQWLLDQQSREKHPFTGAAPGAWGWTPLPGAVPDADDTPGAILALSALSAGRAEQHRGRRWLMDLQNADGGTPTFCRGWSGLPFDRSGSDLTAHALRALSLIGPDDLDEEFVEEWVTAQERAFAYLGKQQRPDGSWLPLWFGNQHAPDDENPTYGTSRVLAAYRDLGLMDTPQAKRGVAFLLSIQNVDGGWGGAKGTPSSVEETALALDVLLGEVAVVGRVESSRPDTEARGEGVTPPPRPSGLAKPRPDLQDAVARGLTWLIAAVEAGRHHEPTPIGFYFAKLWYFEKMYPIAWAVMALGRARHS